MPDDSSPDFKASQQRHAQQIAAEAALQKATGQSLLQVRSRMQEFNSALNDKHPLPPAVQKASTIEPAGQVVPAVLPAKPFGGGDSGKKSIPPPTGAANKFLKDLIVILNGTGYLTNLGTDGRLDAI